jgi:hypothetical protein
MVLRVRTLIATGVLVVMPNVYSPPTSRVAAVIELVVGLGVEIVGR